MPINADDIAKTVVLVENGRSLRHVARVLRCTYAAQRCENVCRDLERLAETRLMDRQRDWRRAGERYAPCTSVPGVNHRRGSIVREGPGMRWYFMRSSNESCLCRGKVLNSFSLLAIISSQCRIMQDVAIARRANEYLDEVELNSIVWLACSADLTPIEHVWDLLDKQVRRRLVAWASLDELRIALFNEWGRIFHKTISDT
ncbi:hypothetical protein QE152_g27648 [Popillia japonica]|uniref:Transposase n=1 Tax=Popillia japonica TaxID=7064 RepID=A0AAW1JUL2_POPJA